MKQTVIVMFVILGVLTMSLSMQTFAEEVDLSFVPEFKNCTETNSLSPINTVLERQG